MKVALFCLNVLLISFSGAQASETCGQIAKLKYSEKTSQWEITFLDGSEIGATYQTVGDQSFIASAMTNKFKVCFIDKKANGREYKVFSSIEQ